MILSDASILSLLDSNELVITPKNYINIGPSSIDLSLSKNIAVYESDKIVLGKNDSKLRHIDISVMEDGYVLNPKDFILAATNEKIRMPNGYQGFIETKGDIARAGLQIHNSDGHVDPGSNHTITLEITNLNVIPVVIFPNILICQLFIHKMTGDSINPYSGKYLGQSLPTGYIAKKV